MESERKQNEYTGKSRRAEKQNTNRRKRGGKQVSEATGSICFRFAETGRCARGDYCKFLHESSIEEDSPALVPKKKKLKRSGGAACFQFARTGRCGKGEGCKFSHENSTDGVTPAPDTETERVSVSGPLNAGKSVHMSDHKFSDLQISAQSRRAMREVFKYEFMTVVQSETLPLTLRGDDCLAKAKTGTGKTLSFLIPTIEKITKANRSISDVSCLCISPTRELAMQISSEAESLIKFHKNIKVVTCVGGTNPNKDVRSLAGSVQIVVATPGRLLDHLQNAGLAKRMKKLDVLIMDEADQLLDMGFRPDIQRILKLLEPSVMTRQTLLFSATVPKSVLEIASIALRPKYSFVDTVGEDAEQTHLHVKQELIISPQADQFKSIASILAKETSQKPYKVIVFFTTARLTGFMAELFNSVHHKTGFKVLEIHSRKNQTARKNASNRFRDSKNAILFSSDVSARGMDYPGVTFVLQVGLTNRDQYIHRLGRTARAGKGGKGALLLAPYEEWHMANNELRDMPLVSTPLPDNDQTDVVAEGLKNVSRDEKLRVSAEQAYRAWLGYYNMAMKKCHWDKNDLVTAANNWAKEAGLKKQPSILIKAAGKMGLRGVRGLILE